MGVAEGKGRKEPPCRVNSAAEGRRDAGVRANRGRSEPALRFGAESGVVIAVSKEGDTCKGRVDAPTYRYQGRLDGPALHGSIYLCTLAGASVPPFSRSHVPRFFEEPKPAKGSYES